MELVMHGLAPAWVMNALLAVFAACMGGLIAARARLYNVQHDAARRP
jgi:hypothetical protein